MLPAESFDHIHVLPNEQCLQNHLDALKTEALVSNRCYHLQTPQIKCELPGAKKKKAPWQEPPSPSKSEVMFQPTKGSTADMLIDGKVLNNVDSILAAVSPLPTVSLRRYPTALPRHVLPVVDFTSVYGIKGGLT